MFQYTENKEEVISCSVQVLLALRLTIELRHLTLCKI